uniref:Uncharacterized protein n=1 Tax=Anguilla anguilla TaxID=7936 RepID=A0A0E9PIF5_ANGAN
MSAMLQPVMRLPPNSYSFFKT